MLPPEMPAAPPPGEALVRHLESLWRQGQRPDVDVLLAAAGIVSPLAVAEVLAADQWQRWHSGERIAVEDYFTRHRALAGDPEAALLLVYGEFLIREEQGESPSAQEYLDRFPQCSAGLSRQLAFHAAVAGAARTVTQAPGEPGAALARLAPPGYEFLEEIGRGGMGVVYKARQKGLNRIVAVKALHGTASLEMLSRFQIEAQAAARLHHPNIVAVYEVGGPEHSFLSMEYVSGGSLAHKLSGTPLPPIEAAVLLETLARAIEYAHSRQVLHRDLTPANVLLVGQPAAVSRDIEGHGGGLSYVPKITDFGLARLLLDRPQLTGSHAIMGTPSYMPPEQARGESNKVGPTADVYSLGAIFYECLTGRPPFKSSTPVETLALVLYDEPVSPRQLHPGVPRDLETICLKCLEKDPARRYPRAQLLANDLRHWLLGEPIEARPAGRLVRAGKWIRRRPTTAALLAVSTFAVLALALTGVVALWQRQTAVEAMTSQQQAQRLEEEERQRRARAEVDALLVADPREARAILERLEEHRADVLPRLRQVWDEPISPRNRARRMRAALALVPVDFGLVRGPLLSWLEEAPDPAELLLIRDVLRPGARRVAEELSAELSRRFEQPGATPKRRLRLLATLAAFDPRGAPWKKAGEVLKPWLEDDPLYRATWTEALRPARDHLVGPLTEVFHGRSLPERRVAAAGILADYLRDRPEILVDLIVEADGQQFDLLLPVLARHRETAIALLSREVQCTVSPPWKDSSIPPTWPSPAADVRSRIEQSSGLLADRFAFVQTLPLGDFASLAERLRKSGYRPVRFRPYPAGRSIQVASVWTRDGLDWQMLHAARASQVRRHDRELRQKGYRPVDVSGWRQLPADREVYSALWAPTSPDTSDTRLFVGVPGDRHQQDGWGPMKQANLHQLTYHVFRAGDGGYRFSSVWGRSPPGLMLSGAEEPEYECQSTPDRVQMDVALIRAQPRPTPAESALATLSQRHREVAARTDQPHALYHRSIAYAQLGDDKRALKDIDSYLRKEKRYAQAFGARAVILARLGRPLEADKDLEQVRRLAKDPGSVLLLESLVSVYLGRDVDWPALDALVRTEQFNASVLFDAAVIHAQWPLRQRLRELTLAASMVGWSDPLGTAVLVRVGRKEAPANRFLTPAEHCARALALVERVLDIDRSWWRAAEQGYWLGALHGHPGYRALLERFHLDREYTAIWHTSGPESLEVHGLAPEAHLERCRQMMARGYRPAAISVLGIAAGQPLVTASVWQRPRVGAAREALARRQAGAGLALMRLGQSDLVWPLLKHSPYPNARTRLIHRLGPGGVPAATLIERLEGEKDKSIRRTLILALGEYRPDQVSEKLRQRLVQKLLAWYRQEADPGIHGAIDWLLRHAREGPDERPIDWGQAKALQRFDKELAGQLVPGRGWYVNGQGQTFSVIDAREPFLMGSPEDEPGRGQDELRHWRRVGRRFALAAKPVTVDQYKRFLKAHPEVKSRYARRNERNGDDPVVGLTWYDSVQYCRWLSEQEGIDEHDMVYPSVAEIEKCKDGSKALRLPVDYLKRKGYRLPTESEWEYACRAGALTCCSNGSAREMLGRYAWYMDNNKGCPWPVGQKKPNDLGLFDMHGQAWSWCQSRAGGYSPASRQTALLDAEENGDPGAALEWDLRGGQFNSPGWMVRSAFRGSSPPSSNATMTGIRVARTHD